MSSPQAFERAFQEAIDQRLRPAAFLPPTKVNSTGSAFRPPVTDDPDLLETWQEHVREITEWDAAFERATGACLWRPL